MTFWDKLGSSLVAVGLAEAQAPAKDATFTPHPATGIPLPPGVAANPNTSLVQTPVVSTPSGMDPARAKELDDRARSIIIEALKNDNAPLVEEISDSIDTLAEAIADEGMRFRTALKMFIKQGHSVAVVLSDFDKCLGALDETKRTFESNMKTALDTQVGAKIRAVETLNGEIAVLQATLNEKIARRDQEQAGITTEQTKITQGQSRFSVVYTNIRRDIEQKRANIVRFGEGL